LVFVVVDDWSWVDNFSFLAFGEFLLLFLLLFALALVGVWFVACWVSGVGAETCFVLEGDGLGDGFGAIAVGTVVGHAFADWIPVAVHVHSHVIHVDHVRLELVQQLLLTDFIHILVLN